MATETPDWGYRVQPADELVSIKLEARAEGEAQFKILHVQMRRRAALRMARELINSALDAGVE